MFCFEFVKNSQEGQHFVVSSRGAHVTAMQQNPWSMPCSNLVIMLWKLQVAVASVWFLPSKKKKLIFGFSYGFGQADHKISAQVVTVDPTRYKDS